MADNFSRAERLAAAVRAATEEFETYSETEKVGLRADQERADEAGRFMANYRWQTERVHAPRE